MFFFKKRPTAPQANRRETYRTLPEGVGELGVTVVGEGMSPLSAELVDLSLYGVGLRLSGARHAQLAAGELYEVRIGSQYHPEIATPAQLRSAHEEQGSWRYGFEFLDVGGLYEQLDDFFVRHFNRRSNRRMRLTAQERIALTMSWEGGSRKLQVADVSSDGVGFAVAAHELPPVDAGDTVGVAFTLPGVPGRIEGTATVARLTLLADRFVLGLAFDRDDPEGLAPHLPAIERFVEERWRVRDAWNALAG